MSVSHGETFIPVASRDNDVPRDPARTVGHRHDFVHPVFTERRSDCRQILTELRCPCGAALTHGFPLR